MPPRGRFTVLAIVFATYLLCYMDRLVIASALPFIGKEFQLGPLAMGGVLSAFFFGYSVMQIPGGLLADRFGPRRVVTVSVVGWSVFTGATGLATSLNPLLALRAIFGLFEGVYPPAASKALAIWFPKHELGRANGIKLAATQLGPALAPPLVAVIVLNWGWRAVFYILLIPGLVLAPVVWRFLKDSPPGHPAEADRATGGAPVMSPLTSPQRPRFVEILRMPSVLWCSVALFNANVANWGLMNWLPTYLMDARGLSVAKMGVYAALPYAAGAIGYYAGGHIGDRYFADRRHVPVVTGLVMSAVATYAAATAATAEMAVVFFIVTMLFTSFALSGIFSLPLLIVPQAVVGATLGVVNTSGQLAAFLSPLLVGYVLEQTGRNFVFVLNGIVCLFLVGAAAACFIRQPLPSAAS